MESRWLGSVVLCRAGLEESVLKRRKRKSGWEGCGDGFGRGWRLRKEVSVSWFSWDENEGEREWECLRLRGE